MKKGRLKLAGLILVLLIPAIFSGTAAATSFDDLKVIRNASMVAGTVDHSVVQFNYHGDLSGRLKDPFVAKINITGKNTEVWEDDFELTGILKTGDSETHNLDCVNSPEEISPGWIIGEFYSSTIPESGNGTFYCYPEKEFFVLDTLSDEKGNLTVYFYPHVALKPDEFEINYSFMSTLGVPEVDPHGETNESGEVNFEEVGLTIKLKKKEPKTRFSIIGYSSLFLNNKIPLNEKSALAYLSIIPSKEVGGEIRINYNQERIDNAGFENPELYLCQIEGGECNWKRVSTQQASNGLLTAEVDHFSLYGIFASEKPKVVTETVYRGGGGVGSYCGDGECAPNENYETCPEDCNPPECPDCPEPSRWSSCSDGEEVRTNYRCNNETDYECEQYVEKESCTAECVPDWSCTKWSKCTDGTQTRDCKDMNNCEGVEEQPPEERSCEVPCKPDWKCTEWSKCENGVQTQKCVDWNNCSGKEELPTKTEKRNCTISKKAKGATTGPTGFLIQNQGSIIAGLVILAIASGVLLYWRKQG